MIDQQRLALSIDRDDLSDQGAAGQLKRGGLIGSIVYRSTPHSGPQNSEGSDEEAKFGESHDVTDRRT
ncbi:MAG: hypothetical protein SynsKO_02500 [Synoicihabitans sp.]